MSNLVGRKILVVDDEPFMRRTIRAVLRAIDQFDIQEADDGDTALVKTDEFRPDVVLCDISMPRMGGLQFVEQLRKHPDRRMRETPVVILTGHADETTVRDALHLKVSGFVVKPVSPSALAVHLRNLFG
jgi:two-component system chemotaxis response regulator CheY